MLVIRLQRTGRSGHAQFRIVVQDRRFSPNKGRIVAYLGSYNPHTKEVSLDGEKTSQYLQNGAQPSDRAARLLQSEGIKLPAWVKLSDPRQRATRNPDKRRSTKPAEPEVEASAVEAAADAPAEDTAADEAPAETPEESAPVDETPTVEPAQTEPADATEPAAEEQAADTEEAAE